MVRVRQRTGFKQMKPYRLWSSKEDASKNVDLFVWYKSVRDKDDPPVPLPHGQWFQTLAPDSSWDDIRDFLSNNQDRTYASKKRKFSTISCSASIKRARQAKHLKAVSDSKEAMQSHATQELPQMRKTYSSLGPRQKKEIQRSVKDVMEDYWSIIAPAHPGELMKCISDIGSKSHVDSQSVIMKSISQAYTLAHEKKDEERKTEILSIFVLQKDMTKDTVEKLVGMEVSGRKFTTAKYHATLYGQGQGGKEVIHHRGAEVKRSIVRKFVAFLMEKGVMTANGRTVHIDGKESVSVPNIKRLEGKQPLIRAFEERERSLRSVVAGDAAVEKVQWLSLRRQSMEEIIAVTCPEKHASMAALDVVGQLHGVINFNVLCKKLENISINSDAIQEKVIAVLKVMKEVEESLVNRNRFRSASHFCGVTDNAGPACHCHYYAFGRVDPEIMLPEEGCTVKYACGHYHRGGCVSCNQIHSLEGLLDDLEVGVSEDVKTKFVELNINYHKQRFLHYRGHQARLTHESQVSAHVKQRLKEDESLLSITADYAMKFLPLKDSEAQNEFFGKAGINWHGICFLWYCPERTQYLQYYVNQCVEDSAEDGVSVVALLRQVILIYYTLTP